MKRFLTIMSLLLLVSYGANAQIIISQYIETNSGTVPKGIELWNTSAGTIDFSVTNLDILKSANGGTASSTFLINTGTIAPGEVIVVGTANMNPDYEKGFNFNGDDGLIIKLDGIVVDVFGDPETGDPPGTGWLGNGIQTYNQNIQLKAGITSGDTDGWLDPSERFELVSADPVNDMTGFGTAPQMATTDPTLTIISPENASIVSSNVDFEFEVSNFMIMPENSPLAADEGHIHYSLDGGSSRMHYTTDPISILDITEGEHTVSFSLVDNNHDPLDPVVETMVTFTVQLPTEVATIADLRMGALDGTSYTLTGEAFVTFAQVFHNQKYIQDATGGIQIDDEAGAFSTMYNPADGITGITGTLNDNNGVLQFIPSMDAGAASSTGTNIMPQQITIAEYLMNYEDYESELIEFINSTFTAGDGSATFATGQNYDLVDESVLDTRATVNHRTNFFDADYIGTIIPDMPKNITVIAGEYLGTPQVTARSLMDIKDIILGLTCEEAIIINEGTHHSNNTTPNPNGDYIYDQWYSFTAPANGDVNISNCTSDVDSYYTISEGTCGNILVTDQDNDDCGTVNSVSEDYTFSVTAGTTYFIGWGNWNVQYAPITPEFDWDLTFVATGPSISITSPAPASTIMTADVNIEFLVENFTIMDGTRTSEGHVHYSIDDGSAMMHYTTDPIELTGLANGEHTVKLWLVSHSHIDLDPMIEASVTFTVDAPVLPTEVANIAELRAGLQDGTEYKLTGEAVITYMQSNRNQKYIQDATGAILIDDNTGNLTTVYNLGDGLTGIVGVLSEYLGVIQFIPIADAGPATSNSNETLPQVITIAEYIATPEDFESELIKIMDANFEDHDGTAIFSTATNYNLTDASVAPTRATIVFRTNFYEANYIDEVIPDNANVTGIAGQYNGAPQIISRDLMDIEILVGVANVASNNISVYPNPSNGSFFVNVSEISSMQILDVTGKTISEQTLSASQNTVSIENAGIYFLRITNGNTTSTHQVIVK